MILALEECLIEASPNFDESPAGQPLAKKTWPSVWSTISLSTLPQENESSGSLFGVSSSKGVDGTDSEKLFIHLARAPNTAVLAKPLTVVSQTHKLPPSMSLFGVLSIPQFDNALTMASTSDFCK